MNYSHDKIPVLVIEDEPAHYEAIAKSLGGERYDLECFPDADNERLLNYKALKQENQIVIVDLNLQGKQDEGLQLIERGLWPADRTTIFIIFSQYIDQVVDTGSDQVHPYWTFVSKETEPNGTTLTADCLSRLSSAVHDYSRMCTPSLRTPIYTTCLLWEQKEQFLRNGGNDAFRSRFGDTIDPSVSRSTAILTDCAQATASYGRAGYASAEIGIGIYGSCGRLEARPDSDVEFSAYFLGDDHPSESKELAVIFWNRLARYMRQRGWVIEGAEMLDQREPPLLHLNDAGEDLPNEYRPVIPIQLLLSMNPQKYPHIRNRHLQILTEMKPVFNPALLLTLKRDLIHHGVGNGVLNIVDIVSHDYLSEIFSQFFLDTQPHKLGTLKDYKRFCYRVLHLLTLRMALIEYICCEPPEMKDDEDWERFFEAISTPGVYKLVRFETGSRRRMTLGDSYREQLQTLLYGTIGTYLDIIARMRHLAEQGQDAAQDQWVSNLKPRVRSCIGEFVALLQLLESEKFFRRAKETKWLLTTVDIERLADRL